MISKRKNDSNRLDYLDMVKGVGIILVVMGHSGYISDNLLTWLASFHMPMFIIISGILFAYKKAWKEDPYSFAKKRAVGMLVPYVVFSVIYLGVYLYYHIFHPDLIFWDFMVDSFLQTISLYGISVLWFLTTLFFAELAFYRLVNDIWRRGSIARLKIRYKAVIAALILVVCAFIPVVGKSLMEQHLHADGTAGRNYITLLLLTIFRTPPAIIYLAAGMIIYYLLIKFKFNKAKEILLGAGFMILHAAIAFANGRTDMHFLVYNNLLLYYAGAITATIGLILIFRNLKSIWFLEFFGANSLIIMLTHLDCQVMSNGIRFASIVNQFVTHGKDYIFRFNLCLFIVVVEIVLILFINRFGYFLIGKRSKVKSKLPVFIEKMIKKRKEKGWEVVK